MGRGNSLGPWRLSDLWYVGLIAVWVLGLAVLPSQTFATTASTQVVSASQENCALDSDPAATVHLEIQAALAIEGDDRILIGRVPIFPVRLRAERGAKWPYVSIDSSDPPCNRSATARWPRHWFDTKRGSPL